VRGGVPGWFRGEKKAERRQFPARGVPAVEGKKGKEEKEKPPRKKPRGLPGPPNPNPPIQTSAQGSLV